MNREMKNSNILLIFTLILTIGLTLSFERTSWAQESPQEDDYFRIMKVTAPEGILLEVGGLAVMPNGNLGVATRRGDIFIVENPTSAKPYFRKFASGLHEVLGLAYKDGAFYCAQRGELTKLQDTDMDGKADVFETIYAWPLSGHYHEYSFGPKIASDGSFFVSGNVAFGSQDWWHGESKVPWRGWMMKITETGEMEPWAAGLRSPAGLGMIDGELFYTDNQGDWMGSGGVWHVEKGVFTGHPASLRWTGMPNSPVKMTENDVFKIVDPRTDKDENGLYVKPENIQNEDVVTLYDLKKSFPEVRTPAVWLPHGILGISNSEILKIPQGTFGPFGGQMLVGDQGQSKIMRVDMEKVNGEYQGVAFDFRSGFRSGVLRMAWAKDGSLFVGETNRGWGSAGDANEGLQRLVWNKHVPFEMRTVRAKPDGFEIEFTRPVDEKSASDLASYMVESFIYKYHPVYGSPTVNWEACAVKGVQVSEDGMTVRLIVDNLRAGHIHHILGTGIRSKDDYYSLVHSSAYYTLNNIPDGKKLTMEEVSTYNSVEEAKKKAAQEKRTSSVKKAEKSTTAKAAKPVEAALTYEDIKPLLAKNTCLACHNTTTRQVGPSFTEIAQRKYTNEQILELIYNPKPENWPGYATPMPPMPQVPKEEVLKIASWINTLSK